ncbi:hypothetical protein [Benzoatithermus flavus]|uniref:Uncharacterized protein n=1 Tax=Benzoatithermus flavus TaxID=3108223 RepID=A0ABU8XN53_9PROT
MMPDLGARIEAMYRSDRLYAWLFVLALWIVVGFVLVSVWGLVADARVQTAMTAGAVLVLLFNTASIGAMVRHYHEDKAFIYGLDIKYLDALEAQRRNAAALMRPVERGT